MTLRKRDVCSLNLSTAGTLHDAHGLGLSNQCTLVLVPATVLVAIDGAVLRHTASAASACATSVLQF
jgi:hypothetical protein